MAKPRRHPEGSLQRFAADAPKGWLARTEEWRQSQITGRPSDRDFLKGMLRLFLAVPDRLRTAAVYGTDEECEAIVQKLLQSHVDAVVDDRQAARAVAASTRARTK